MRSQYNSKKPTQRGAALMVMLVILIIGASAFLVSSLNSSKVKSARQTSSSIVLAKAKDALIGYALSYGDTHTGEMYGYLPCPDPDGTNGSNGEGSSETCGNKNVSAIGRLPWKTLGLNPLRDGEGECLWYAVSGTYKNNPKTDLMNWDNRGLLEVLDTTGNIAAQDVVAVIFSPGSAQENQNRAPNNTAPICGGNYTATNYLDSNGTINNGTVSSSPNVTSQFKLAGSTGQINDQILFITRQELWNALLKRNDFIDNLKNMTREATVCLSYYGKMNGSYASSDKRLPWAGRFLNPSDDYWTDANYDDEDGRMAGRLPYRVNTSRNATGNLISGTSPYQLLADGTNCPLSSNWPNYYTWWTNWKDHLYYAVSNAFEPNGGSSSCSTDACLTVNGSGQYAAVVMFAGQSLSGQSRNSTSDRLDISNYLEGRNLSNGDNTSGDSNYESGASSAGFNDILYCINPNLSVTPC